MKSLDKAIKMCDSSVGYKVYKSHTGDYVLTFYYNRKIDLSVKGTNGTGVKLYPNEQKAKEAGERYLKKMKSEGFELERY